MTELNSRTSSASYRIIISQWWKSLICCTIHALIYLSKLATVSFFFSFFFVFNCTSKERSAHLLRLYCFGYNVATWFPSVGWHSLAALKIGWTIKYDISFALIHSIFSNAHRRDTIKVAFRLENWQLLFAHRLNGQGHDLSFFQFIFLLSVWFTWGTVYLTMPMRTLSYGHIIIRILGWQMPVPFGHNRNEWLNFETRIPCIVSSSCDITNFFFLFSIFRVLFRQKINENDFSQCTNFHGDPINVCPWMRFRENNTHISSQCF